MPIKNIVGQKFGHLTVERLSQKRHPKNNKILWECKCDCGNDEIIYATTGNLTQGYKTSCGCAKLKQIQELGRKSAKDLTNQKFGKLTALYRLENISPPMWHCLCDCGNEIDVRSIELTSNNTTSCGCKRKDLRKNLIGQKFGKLTVIERSNNYVSPKGQSQVMYICKCDCGKEVEVASSSLQQGFTNSCGCLRSMGENLIDKYLTELNINFQREYIFEDCKDKRPLPFDFVIFDTNNKIKLLIEVNGKQHYEPSFYKEEDDAIALLEYTQKHDLIKQEYCKNNNYDLLIIPYWELNNFKSIINERLKINDV